MISLLNYLNGIYPLSTELSEHLYHVLKRKELAKKEILFKENSICNYIYFIESGLFRCYYTTEKEKDVCSWFMKTGDIIISVESFFNRVPSKENIQALEESVVYYVSYSELSAIYNKYLEFNYIGRVVTEKYYCQSEQRLYWIRMNTATQRYKLLLKNYPELLQLVPAKFIASFLGISVETLSRLKNNKRL